MFCPTLRSFGRGISERLSAALTNKALISRQSREAEGVGMNISFTFSVWSPATPPRPLLLLSHPQIATPDLQWGFKARIRAIFKNWIWVPAVCTHWPRDVVMFKCTGCLPSKAVQSRITVIKMRDEVLNFKLQIGKVKAAFSIHLRICSAMKNWSQLWSSTHRSQEGSRRYQRKVVLLLFFPTFSEKNRAQRRRGKYKRRKHFLSTDRFPPPPSRHEQVFNLRRVISVSFLCPKWRPSSRGLHSF